ncbi:hypothetical protein B11Q_00006 [Corynebacterium diphtheriae]|uniref:DUF6918 family protein n=1 Tax=Corynebacterium diphtheriae TaxID=1717 RepID=UPI000D742731|nr:hypothetical protein [Corynebacterium diphtheriae]AWR14736.1 hypothetical protein B11Q_00006 [Corynebacterium diphtheriae]
MSTLAQLLDTKRTALAAELAGFIDRSVSQSSAISGVALKGAVAAAKKVRPDIVTKGAERLLPEVVEVLDPYWASFEASDSTHFGEFLEQHKSEVSDKILEVADRNAEKVDMPALKKAYGSLRGKAASFIEPNLPGLGQIMQNYMK